MRGISKETLERKLATSKQASKSIRLLLESLINECQELNPWMTLDEFLRSGFEGWCWINSGFIDIAYAYQGVFYWNDQVESPAYDIELITHVQPIHKPEPPQDD